jgi:hypothetical protein
MGDPYKGRIAGHIMTHGRVGVFRGYPDEARCECGAHSEPLKTVEQRIAWHQQHKADMVDKFVANGVDDRGREVHL